MVSFLYNANTVMIVFMAVVLPVIVVLGFIYRLYRAKKNKKSVKEAARRYVGSAFTRFDPITGAPINVVDKAAVVEYVEEHFEEGQNDETGIYGKDRDDY